MYDAHTLVVTYNEKRGENRGPRKPKVDYRDQGLGDCIDCTWCVQVCPVDIDIRDGLQYECINCGLCVDACDSIMDKMGYDRGLISFTTENNIAGGKTKLIRPRLLGYVFFIVLMAGALITTLVQRVPMEADIERDRNVMHRINNDGFIENPYRVKIVNMLGDTHRYELRIIDNERFVLSGDTSIEVEGGDVKEGIILITVDPADIDRFRYDIEVEVKAIDDPDLVKTIETRFMAPQVR
jgi:cytochrome c oxidase accessory protein FixG